MLAFSMCVGGLNSGLRVCTANGFQPEPFPQTLDFSYKVTNDTMEIKLLTHRFLRDVVRFPPSTLKLTDVC